MEGTVAWVNVSHQNGHSKSAPPNTLLETRVQVTVSLTYSLAYRPRPTARVSEDVPRNFA